MPELREGHEITQLLAEARKGDRAAENQLMPLIYKELRRLAAVHMRRERRNRPNHTLQETALVHEAYLRLLPQRVNWESRSHFFGVAAEQMRRILVDYARKRKAAKREGAERKIQLDEALVMTRERPSDLLEVHEALNTFAQDHQREARVVELRFFGGYTGDEIARILGISVETVKRDWRFAKAWFADYFKEPQGIDA